MESVINKLVGKYLPANAILLYVCEYGSRNYGIELPDSDHDVFAIYLSPLEYYLRTNIPNENNKQVYKIEDEDHLDVSIVYLDIKHVIDRLGSGNCSFIELIFSNIIYYNHDVFDFDPIRQRVMDKFDIGRMLQHWHAMGKTYDHTTKYKSRKRYINKIRCLLSADLAFCKQWPDRTLSDMVYSCVRSSTIPHYMSFIESDDPDAIPDNELLADMDRRAILLENSIKSYPVKRTYEPYPFSDLFFKILNDFYSIKLDPEKVVQEWLKHEPN